MFIEPTTLLMPRSEGAKYFAYEWAQGNQEDRQGYKHSVPNGTLR